MTKLVARVLLVIKFGAYNHLMRWRLSSAPVRGDDAVRHRSVCRRVHDEARDGIACLLSVFQYNFASKRLLPSRSAPANNLEQERTPASIVMTNALVRSAVCAGNSAISVAQSLMLVRRFQRTCLSTAHPPHLISAASHRVLELCS